MAKISHISQLPVNIQQIQQTNLPTKEQDTKVSEPVICDIPERIKDGDYASEIARNLAGALQDNQSSALGAQSKLDPKKVSALLADDDES